MDKTVISSTSNGKVKYVSALVKKAKARREEGLFVVEGVKMFSELPKNRLRSTFVSESFLLDKTHRDLVKGILYEVVSDDIFKSMSDTQTPQGILALVKQFSYTLNDLFPEGREAHLMILETLQDPGNLGTILRAGEGAGLTGVIMNAGTADIYNPKVIRSTMGSIYRVPFIYVENMAETLKELKKRNVNLYAAHLDGKNDYDQESYKGDTGFLIGNEAAGLSNEIAAMADTYIRIPMLGKVESLNAAIAASVLMFEAARQRRG